MLLAFLPVVLCALLVESVLGKQVANVPYFEPVVLGSALNPEFELQTAGLFSDLPAIDKIERTSWQHELPGDGSSAVASPQPGLDESYFEPHAWSELARPEAPESNAAATAQTEILITSAEPSQHDIPESATPILSDPVIIAPVQCNSCQSQTSDQCRHCGGRRLPGRTRWGRFIGGVYAEICNPDPCYQPEWSMLPNASLFTDAARPQTRQRFRWDYFNGYQFPDRAEYLWGRSNVIGPAAERSINYHELSMYVETGSEKFSFFVNTPYRSNYLDSGGHFAGMSDLTIGTKTLLHDSSLLQVALQFETHVPSANPIKGLGSGHVSLEPALIFGIRTSPRGFLQAQLGEWIPLGGDPTFAGASLTYSASYNRTLREWATNTSLIGTLEYSGLSFQDGAYTDPATLLPVNASGASLGMLGSGLRLNVCDKFNVGFGVQFGVTEISPATSLRTEIQFRH